MRSLVPLAVAALAACTQASAPDDPLGPPPLDSSDFALPTVANELGDWATGDPAELSTRFDAMLEERYLLYSVDAAVSDLESFGYDCLIDRGYGATCSNEVGNRACGHVWDVRIRPVRPDGAVIEDVEGSFTKECVGDAL